MKYAIDTQTQIDEYLMWHRLRHFAGCKDVHLHPIDFYSFKMLNTFDF